MLLPSSTLYGALSPRRSRERTHLVTPLSAQAYPL